MLPKVHFYEILSSVVLSLREIHLEQANQPLNQVLIYEHCHCIHVMTIEIGYWLNKADQFKSGSRLQEELPKDISELRGTQQWTDSNDDQIALSQLIDQ